MTTDRRQSGNRRLVRVMVVITLVFVAIAFALYGFAAWSASVINCAEAPTDADACGGATTAMWVFCGLTLAALLGAGLAWRKLDA